MPCEGSIVDAKAEFVVAVRKGIEALLTHRGYSRERATNALLREFNRGAESSEGRPNDADIFEVMRKHNLGIEDATRALVVSRAIRSDFSRSSALTPAAAIEQLISKISIDNILYDSSDDEVFSDDDDKNRRLAIHADLRVDQFEKKSTGTSRTTTPNKISNNRSSDAELRQTARKRQLSQQSPRKSSKHNNVASSTSRGGMKGTSTLTGRKRSVDEIGDKQQQQAPAQGPNVPPRGRADSVSSEVDAKISATQRVAANPDCAPVVNEGNSRPPCTKRAHRPAEDVIGTISGNAANIHSGAAFGQRS